MVNLRMFSSSFLSSCTIDHDLQEFRFAHAVHSDVIPTLMLNVNFIQFENKHFEVVGRCLN